MKSTHLILLLFFVPWLLIAQDKVVLDGIVSSPDNGPVEGVTILTLAGEVLAVTDNRGRFRISMPTGKHMLTFTHISYHSKQIEHDFQSPEYRHVVLEPSTLNLQEVVISETDPRDNLESTIAGVTRLSLKNIERLPAFLGETDVIKSITLLPGVNTVGEGSTGFNVRGGGTDQNLITIDGMQLFNTSHVLGFFSIFHPDATKDFTLYKGHIPARYGGRTSSVLAVNSLQGHRDKWSAEGAIGTFSGKLTVQGPVTQSLSILAAGRITYSDWILSRIKDLDVRSSAADFYDGFIRVDNVFNDRHQIMFSLLKSRDRFNYAGQFGFEWENLGFNGRYEYQVSPNIKLELGGNYLRYSSSLMEFETGLATKLDNEMRKIQTEANLHWTHGKHSADGGYNYTQYNPSPQFFGPLDNSSQIQSRSVDLDKGVEMAFYLQDVFELSPNIEINAGIRFNLFFHKGPYDKYIYDSEELSDENIVDTVRFGSGTNVDQLGDLAPRLAIRYKINDRTSLKASYNRMFQYLHLISNTSSATPVDQWQVSTSYIPPTQSDNYSLGVYKNLRNDTWITSLEGFYKDQKNVLEYKDFAELLVQENIEAELLQGDGRSYGLEFFVKHISRKWNGWVTYVYTRSEIQVMDRGQSINEGHWFPTYYDQPHSFKFVSDLKVGEKNSFGASMIFNTGRPITGLESNYRLGQLVIPHFSDRNQYRIPNYFRVDVSFTIGSIINKFEDKLILSVYNLMGRKNAYSIYYEKPEDISIPQAYKLSVLGSIFPSITYSIELP